MNRGDFWRSQCPARGPALTHVHMAGCTAHALDQCCECGRRPQEYATEIVTSSGANAPEADPLKEPKLATGELSGPPDGLGRGGFTPFQKMWIEHQVLGRERRRGYR